MEQIQTAYQPDGPLGGLYQGMNAANASTANQLQFEQSGLNNVIKGVQAGRDLADFSNPEYEKFRQLGDMGKNKSAAAKGEIDYSTMDGEIKAKIAEQAARIPKAQAEQEVAQSQVALNGIRKIAAIGEQTGYDGLQFITSAKQIASQLSVEPEMVQQFAKARPEQRKQMLAGLAKSHEAIVTYVPEVLRKNAEATHLENAKIPGHLAGIALQNAGHAATNAATNANQVLLEDMRIKAGKYDKKAGADAALNKAFLTLPTDRVISVLEEALTTNTHPVTGEELSETERIGFEARKKRAEKVKADENAAKLAGKPDPNQFGIKTFPVPGATGSTTPGQPRKPLSSFGQ